jgi:hypothetical protein
VDKVRLGWLVIVACWKPPHYKRGSRPPGCPGRDPWQYSGMVFLSASRTARRMRILCCEKNSKQRDASLSGALV